MKKLKPCSPSLLLMFPHCTVFEYLLLLLYGSYSVLGQVLDSRIANLSTLWSNNPQYCPTKLYADGSMVNLIIDPPASGPHFAFGFYCGANSTSFYLAVFLNYPEKNIGFPPVVWSANRNSPVKENSTLEFTKEGDLVLKDVHDNLVWSTNTSGRSVVGLELTGKGNLVLFDESNATVWQSLDHPTDTLVLGQKLLDGQKLIASTSTINRSEGMYYISATDAGLSAYIQSDPPLPYFSSWVPQIKLNEEPSYVKFLNGSLAFYITNAEPYPPDLEIPFSPGSLFQYMQLGSDGHLRVYDWDFLWKDVTDVLSPYVDECVYPLVCGKYGICSKGQCSCPGDTSNDTRFFQPINRRQPNLGCPEITPLSCEASQYHRLLDLAYLYCFNPGYDMIITDIEGCKRACLENCSCKSAFFVTLSNMSNGDCYMQSEVYSFIDYEVVPTGLFNYTAFVKVQTTEEVTMGTSSAPPSSILQAWILPLCLVMLFCLLLVTRTVIHSRKKNALEKHGTWFESVPGIPMRFSYNELNDATRNFSCKVGEGAAGSVYEGNLPNGTKVAVKRLHGLRGREKMSFIAEVEAIGSVHHVNLVKLIGFCADESHMLLVYEFLCNGSLDNWIFRQKQETSLGWRTRQKIILDIAKGLAYLHEECTQKILHLDIKPQNILLDQEFNAKVSDFGLSKLIDRNQSKVMTTMRGTPGYMAPEWCSCVITEKVDVYSFGIVVMEVLCGQKNVDFDELGELMHLLSLLEKSADEDVLHKMIDSNCGDMKLHSAEVLDTMRLVLWCVHGDFSKRPSMSVVVKVLDGLMDKEANKDNNFYKSLPSSSTVACDRVGSYVPSPLLPTVLSGPR